MKRVKTSGSLKGSKGNASPAGPTVIAWFRLADSDGSSSSGARRRLRGGMAPFQGWVPGAGDPGRWPGLRYHAPLGLGIAHTAGRGEPIRWGRYLALSGLDARG